MMGLLNIMEYVDERLDLTIQIICIIYWFLKTKGDVLFRESKTNSISKPNNDVIYRHIKKTESFRNLIIFLTLPGRIGFSW